MTAELATALADHGVYLLSKQRREEVSAALHRQGVTVRDVAELDAWIRSREDNDAKATKILAGVLIRTDDIQDVLAKVRAYQQKSGGMPHPQNMPTFGLDSCDCKRCVEVKGHKGPKPMRIVS